MRQNPTEPVGTRLPGSFVSFLDAMAALYNYKKKKRISRSDVVRMCLERGAPILAEEFRKELGETVELVKGADVSKFGVAHKNGRMGWRLKHASARAAK